MSSGKSLKWGFFVLPKSEDSITEVRFVEGAESVADVEAEIKRIILDRMPGVDDPSSFPQSPFENESVAIFAMKRIITPRLRAKPVVEL